MYMIPREKGSRSRGNVTNLADVRQARALTESMVDEQSTINTQSAEQSTLMADEPGDKSTDGSHGNRRFDAEKVARIKAAIAAGKYKIDAYRVANRFIEHDRNQ